MIPVAPADDGTARGRTEESTVRLASFVASVSLLVLTSSAVGGTPSVRFTSVPPFGSMRNLRGRVRGVPRAAYRVAVYIRVNGGWWTKPSFAEPLTRLRPGGRWRCDITTGGHDEDATEIAAFVVPSAVAPALAGGDAELPAAMEAASVASATVER